MEPDRLKVGELAKRAGVSVRTLHYYDEIELLSPSHHTASGHRLYAPEDVARLQQIHSLRQLGLSLDEVRAALEDPDFVPHRLIEQHLERIASQKSSLENLERRLGAIGRRLESTGDASVVDLLEAVKEMNAIETYYTPEQLNVLEQARR